MRILHVGYHDTEGSYSIMAQHQHKCNQVIARRLNCRVVDSRMLLLDAEARYMLFFVCFMLQLDSVQVSHLCLLLCSEVRACYMLCDLRPYLGLRPPLRRCT